MVELNLDRLESGRRTLELDDELVREEQVLQGHRVGGFTAHVRGELLVENMDQKILVHGTFTATRTMNCDHCGNPFELEYPAEVEILVYRSPRRGHDEEVGEDDNWVIHQPGGVVDLTDSLLEAVVLDQPQHAVDPAHHDLVPVRRFGSGDGESEEESEDTIDPRWAALRQLKDDGDAPDES